jgi:ubiquinone/menaquinone biosynthesis C-methylase UbiE
MSLIRTFKGLVRRMGEFDPADAYDLWAETYDHQPSNLMLELEEAVFDELIGRTDWRGKMVLDIGCGTGRHWPRILAAGPGQLWGWDVSAGMLRLLRQKHPDARTSLLPRNAYSLLEVNDASAGVIISTLAVAHISNLRRALQEWNRVLQNNGEVMITDYHPAALVRGADRTFHCQGTLVSIKNYVHSLDKIRKLAGDLGWVEVDFIERKIDKTMKPAYAVRGAIRVYEQFLDVPIVYGWRFRKHAYAS